MIRNVVKSERKREIAEMIDKTYRVKMHVIFIEGMGKMFYSLAQSFSVVKDNTVQFI